MPPDILPFPHVRPEHADLVGGKGLSLGLTATAGLPVPPGFCVTTAAYRRCASDLTIDSTLADALSQAYRELGGGVVAVRSSATAEDGAAASFAGQQETILGVEGDADLKAAVERCWKSLHTDRAKAYRAKQGVDEGGLAMAVVVQRLVDADVAGVMFTRDPLDPTGTLMRVEAAWGLGEAVVSGRVTPDRFQVERGTARVQDRQAGRKDVRFGRRGEEPVPADQQTRLCLTDADLAALADLGRQVEEFYGDPRDVEWAIAGGTVWLLQARPITAGGAADRMRLVAETVARLKALAVTPTVWSRTTLIEVLPEPTPMTWRVVSGRLLSGGGGTGAMYRDFGFNPDPALASTSAYDLIGGRPYLNLAREPRLESKKPLSGYPLAAYKVDPARALNPKRDDPRGLRKWLGLFGIVRVTMKVVRASDRFAAEFRETIIPPFAAAVEKAAGEDLSKLDPSALVSRFETWANRTLVEFARHSLKPTLLADFSWRVVEDLIRKPLGADRAREVLTALSQGAKSDPDADLPGAIRSLARGDLSPAEFLRRFGHRGPNEMELAAPRWSENPVGLTALAAGSSPTAPAYGLAELGQELKWNGVQEKMLTLNVGKLQTYLGLRETGKHHLMRGYAEVRRTLVELDRRFGLDGGIFYLTPEELPALVAGTDLKGTANQRRTARAVELTLEVPPVLFSDDVEAIGRPLPPPVGAENLTGVPLSAGVAEGPALVLTEPTAAPEPGYILVCPSTDPAWVPLFVHARGLVMESGGTLSHGAIVAREFGLPAVAGLPGVQHRIKSGQRVRVDGGRGTVSVLS
jgi:rifampicin phosphotransferase